MSKRTTAFLMAFMALTLVFGASLSAAASDKVARKHLALGDALYKQGKIDQAVDEWKVALEIDPSLKKAETRIRQAEQADHKVDFSEPEEGEEPTPEATAEALPDVDAVKLQAEILEVQKMGGRPAKVIMNAGAQKGVRPGQTGVIVDGSGVPMAAFIVRLIDPDKSLADVTSSSRDIPDTAIAVINIPKQ